MNQYHTESELRSQAAQAELDRARLKHVLAAEAVDLTAEDRRWLARQIAVAAKQGLVY